VFCSVYYLSAAPPAREGGKSMPTHHPTHHPHPPHTPIKPRDCHPCGLSRLLTPNPHPLTPPPQGAKTLAGGGAELEYLRKIRHFSTPNLTIFEQSRTFLAKNMRIFQQFRTFLPVSIPRPLPPIPSLFNVSRQSLCALRVLYENPILFRVSCFAFRVFPPLSPSAFPIPHSAFTITSLNQRKERSHVH